MIPRSRAAVTTGASAGTPGLLTSVRARVDQVAAWRVQMHFDARLAKPPGVGRAHVDADHLLPPRAQRERRGLAGAGQAHDQVRAAWQAGRGFTPRSVAEGSDP